jgi:glycosyltransferase involved in cell wall biosynthesis
MTPPDMRRSGPPRRLSPELYEALVRLGSVPEPPRGSKVPELAPPNPDLAPSVSVVVTSSGNLPMLERCVRSIVACAYDDFELIVVGHGPRSLDTPRMLLTQFPGEGRLRYVDQASTPVSLARNSGLARVETEVVAFTDEDVIVDRLWLRAGVEALLSEPGIGCVTGISLSRGLTTHNGRGTETLLLPERWRGSHERLGRTTYRYLDGRKERPVLPFATGTLGSGPSIVMLTEVGRQLGGFDPALGPATLTCGGECLDLLIRLLRRGYALSYEPRAIVWRERPADAPARRREVYRHGVGVGAMLGKQLVTGPRRRNLLRAIPTESTGSPDPAAGTAIEAPPRRPRHLRWLGRLGMLVGPIAYLASAVIARARRLTAKKPPRSQPVRAVRRMVVGGETVNVVWFKDVETPRVRFAWRRVGSSDTQSHASELALASALAIARPATTPTGQLRISVVVPTRNAAAWIESCLQAIRANDPAEIIVVDGESTDGTAELARQWADKVISDRGAGVAAARMIGVSYASHPWIAFVDADVILPPNALRDLDRERSERRLVALQAGLHSIGNGDYWSQSLADHHNQGKSKHWFGVCATLIARDLLLAHPLDGALSSGEDIDLRIRLAKAGFRVGVSETMVCRHRFATGFKFARRQWTADGAGLGRMVRKHGRTAIVSAMMPFGAAALGVLRGVGETLRPWPYFAGFAVGNYAGMWRGLADRGIPIRGLGRRLLVAAMLVWLLAIPAALAAVGVVFALSMERLGKAAYQGHLLLLTLAILAVAIPFEVGRGAGNDRFSAIARRLAPFTALGIAVGLILSGLRLARVVGL